MTSLWSSSTELMLLGMGTVFVFLTLLVFGVTLMSAIINKVSTPEQPTAITPVTTANAEVAAVAAAAWATSKSSNQ